MSHIASRADDPALPQAYREILGGPVVVISIIASATTAVAWAVVGPVGIEDDLTLIRRLCLVVLCCLTCWPFCQSLAAVVLYLVRSRPPFQIGIACTVGTAYMTIPCTAVTFLVFSLVRPDHAAPQLALFDLYTRLTVFLFAWSALVHYVAFQRAELRIATAAASDVAGAEPQHASVDPKPPSSAAAVGAVKDEPTGVAAHGALAAESARSRFFARLPDALGRDVVFLNVSGHYVNVVTTTGSCLILMRFADAIGELGDLGMQVHRSYWVAHRHVTGILRRDERTLVRVAGRHELPVSRTHLATVRAKAEALKEQRKGTPARSPPTS